MKEKIEKIILDSLTELNEEIENEELEHPTKSTKLYGAKGVLDSLALVSLLADIEERVSEELDVEIVLADEKAMSQRVSPFRDVESLSSYIQKIIKEQ